jgi:hypothetical protein
MAHVVVGACSAYVDDCASQIARTHPDEFVRTGGTSVGEHGKTSFSPRPDRRGSSR